MDLRIKCRQTCQGDPWQRMSRAEKEMWGAGRPAPQNLFSAGDSSSARGNTLLFAFHTEMHGKSLLLSTANANENANANAICF